MRSDFGERMHWLLVEYAKERLLKKGFNINKITGEMTALDILATKGNFNIGVMCCIKLYPKRIKQQINKFKNHFKLIFCVPSFIKIPKNIKDVEFWKVDFKLELVKQI